MANYPMFYDFVNRFDYTRKYILDMENFYKYEEYIGTSRIDPSYLDNSDGNYETFIGCYLIYEEHNYTDSINFFEDARKKGNLLAIFELAWFYQDIVETNDCYKKSIEYLEEIVKHDPEIPIVVDSMNQLALLICRDDRKRAIELLEISSSKGNLNATENLAWFYINKNNNFKENKEIDLKKSLKYFNIIFENTSSYPFETSLDDLIYFLAKIKKFDLMINYAYKQWLCRDQLLDYWGQITHHMKKVTNMVKLLDISVKVNKFEEIESRDYINYFNTPNKIDMIMKYINSIGISNSQKKRLQITFEEKYLKIINNMIFRQNLPCEVSDHIINSYLI